MWSPPEGHLSRPQVKARLNVGNLGLFWASAGDHLWHTADRGMFLYPLGSVEEYERWRDSTPRWRRTLHHLAAPLWFL